MRCIKVIVFFMCCVIGLFVFDNFIVSANYNDVCSGERIQAKVGTYIRCENNNIYLLKNNVNKSSYIVANRDIELNNQILYAGKIDGIDTFYSTAFNYYSVVHDESNIISFKGDAWSDISINGVVFYSGKFNDNVLINQSSQSFVTEFFDEKGTYLIRQYVDGDLYNVIKIIVVDRDDLKVGISEVRYGGELINSNNLAYQKENKFKINIIGGDYGFDNNVNIKINECSLDVIFKYDLEISGDKINECLKQNDTNKLSITINNGLKKGKIFKYDFYLSGKNASIKLEDSFTNLSSSSRRIVIKASPGLNKTLDNDLCLYYWSKSPDDKLTYKDFMTNYELSENKGTYTSNKGVILRGNYGTYYLYAIAKDEESIVVVRSDEYIIEKNTRINRVVKGDIIFVLGLCVCAFVPIIIYVFVRGKDTY